jgi:NADPH:quinone reductase-like Zn-dependent oxidoreductase
MALQNRGIVKIAKGEAILTSIPIPKLRDNYILIKTIAVAINPADWQTLDEEFVPGTTRSLLGLDASGIVVEVGKSVTKKFKKGDRVSGFAHGGINIVTGNDPVLTKAKVTPRTPKGAFLPSMLPSRVISHLRSLITSASRKQQLLAVV